MPWIPFFADQEDAEILLKRLNADDAIAFIVSEKSQNSPQQKWKAVSRIDRFETKHYGLWHIPTRPPLVMSESGSRQPIPDLWEGWLDPRPSADPTNFCFGAGAKAHRVNDAVTEYISELFGTRNPAEIRLELRLRHQPYSEAERTTLPALISYWTRDFDCLVISNFQFANRSHESPQQTMRWWRRLRAFFDREAISLDYPNQRFWAFPSAFEKLKDGMRYDANGFDLTEAIQAAEARKS